MLAGLGLLYWFPMRRWFRHWGSSDTDRHRPMRADADIIDATYETTLAVTVAARPEHVWPWLVQIGNERGGLYSYDWLDRMFGFLNGPSADRILPEFQSIRVGDVIPVGRGAGFPVKAIDPYRTLVLGGATDDLQWTWEFGLYPIGERHTRVVSRNRAHVPRTLGLILFMAALEPAAFVMTRRMLLGLKRRAQRLAAEDPDIGSHAA